MSSEVKLARDRELTDRIRGWIPADGDLHSVVALRRILAAILTQNGGERPIYTQAITATPFRFALAVTHESYGISIRVIAES